MHHAYFPETLIAGGRGGLRNPQTSAQLFGMDPGHQKVWGARWRMQCTISKGFINRTEIVTAATSPSCSIEITCYQVNFLRNHNGTKSLDELLGNAFLLGINVADMQGQ